MKKLHGKVAIVTGAARGIGRAYAIKLAQLGADVGVVDIDLKSYEQFDGEAIGKQYETVVDELTELGVKAVGVEVDVMDEKGVYDAFELIRQQLGPIDILIANAGGGSGDILQNSASQIDIEQLRTVYDRNFIGTVNSVKAVVEDMKEKNYGKIVTVSSVTGLQSTDGGTYAHYGSTKAAIVAYTKYLAQELGVHNINVNAVAPGYIATGRLKIQFEKAGAENYTNQTALKRFGTPEDCANVIEFLATDLSDYVTGSVIDITGGLVK